MRIAKFIADNKEILHDVEAKDKPSKIRNKVLNERTKRRNLAQNTLSSLGMLD